MSTHPPEASPKLTAALIADLRARADVLGLAVTVKCQHCGAPLWDDVSVSAHAGPICRRRHENDPGAHSAKNARTEAAQINHAPKKEQT